MLAVFQIQRIILAYKEAIESSGERMPPYMRDNLKTLFQYVVAISTEPTLYSLFICLQRQVKHVLETFNKYESHGHLSRVLLRHQSRREVKHCADMMWATVTLFNVSGAVPCGYVPSLF